MSTTTTEIEKKSLEAHVDLCAQRYRFLEEKISSMDQKIEDVAESVTSVKTSVELMASKNTDRLINWGIGIIVSLIGIVGWLLSHYVLK